MSFLFGKKKTPAEMLREHQRVINRAIREMDREKMKLENAEKKLIADIKREAKKGNNDVVRLMAKDLVRTRKNVKKFTMMKIQLNSVNMKLMELKTNDSMARAMAGCTKAMAKMNKTMNLPAMQKIMMEFEKQSEMMEMKSEMMDDVIDNVMEDADDEEETEEIVSKVLDELGLSLEGELADTPATAVAAPAAPQKQAVAEGGGSDALDDDLQARLDALRRG